ncbi:MAG: universal stress protein [Deltaproteobacteria bacterium]|nr:universal stress protein [Deltaproteobacteria bacterium]
MLEYPKYKKILLCTDFSKNSELAFIYACAIAERDKGKIYLIHILPVMQNEGVIKSLITPHIFEKAQKESIEGLEQVFQEQLISKCQKDIEFQTVIRVGREYQEILKFALEEEVDLIVLGTHGLTGLGHVLMGSVAEKVVRNSPVPVLIIPIPPPNRHKSKGEL